MSIEFENRPAEWNNEGVEPSIEAKNNGFSPGDKPPAAWINWQFNKTYKSIDELQDTVSDIDTEVKKTVPISKGGTGATTASVARTNLGVVPITREINNKQLNEDISLDYSDVGAAASSHNHSADDITSGTLPISRGGTGATDIYTAHNNLGLMKRYKNFDHLTLSDNCTITDILTAMSSNTYIETAVSTVSKYHNLFPGTQGFARLVKVNADRSYAEFRNFSGNGNVAGFWIGYHRPNSTFTGWKKIYTSFDTVPIENGGTGATSASTALTNLGAVPTTRTINSKALSSDITLNASDVGSASYEVKTGADFNDMKTPGLYSMKTSTTNAPTSGSYHSLIVNKSDNEDYVQQIAVKESTYEVYTRYYNGSTWSSWKQFSMVDHIQSVDKGGTGATTASGALTNLGAVPTSRTVNSKALSDDISLTYSDVGALPFSNIIQEKVYLTGQHTISVGDTIKLVINNPFLHNSTYKVLGATSYYIIGTPPGGSDKYVLEVTGNSGFVSDISFGYIRILNSSDKTVKINPISYIVFTAIKP